jgi:cytochrome P450
LSFAANSIPGVTIPGPSRLTALARIPRFRRNELAGFRYGWETHGDLYHVRFGWRDLWICSHPDLIHQVLVAGRDNWRRINELPDGRPFGLKMALGDGLLTTDGDDWQWRRRIVNPAFHRQRLEAMVEIMAECGAKLIDRLGAVADSGREVDLLHEMKLVTQDIISKTMFSADISGDADRIGNAVDEALQYVAKRSRALVSVPRSWPTPAARRFDRAIADLDDAIYRAIAARREMGNSGDDLLGMLIEADDTETGRQLSDAQIRNEVATVYGAGHETTANALTWAWHELMQSPHILKKLQAEVDALGDDSSAMATLPYARMVLEETLRFRPPVPINGRFALEPDQLGGYEVAPGAVALLIVNNVHRHPGFWRDPDRFDPERFSPEDKKDRHRYAWSPFGAGPHLCIGNNFALLEGTLLLVMMARHLAFEPAAPLPRPPALAVTLKPRGGLPVRVTRR